MLTAQVLLDMLNHGFICLSRANVLVFDECHHVLSKKTGGQHPFAQLMKKYRELPGDRPRVLGLTASLIKTDVAVDKLKEKVRPDFQGVQ